MQTEKALHSILGSCWTTFARAHGCASADFCVRAIGQDADMELLTRLRPERREEWKRLAVASESRRQEWTEGRRCELELRDTLGEDCFLSVSHSGGCVAVIGAQPGVGSGVCGIGVDVELASRAIDDRARRRFLKRHEQALDLSNLEFWVAKEAAFKSDPGNAGTFLGDYILKSLDPADPARPGVRQALLVPRDSSKEIFVQICTGPEWVLGMAICVTRRV